MSAIQFFNEGINFSLKNKRVLKSWIQEVATIHSSRIISGINYIFCDDVFLLALNKKFLDHNTLTDIITFDQSEDEDCLLADIYISTERIKENSKIFNTSFQNEVHRVMIHGLLHLIGFKDSTEDEKAIMRRKENECLALLKI